MKRSSRSNRTGRAPAGGAVLPVIRSALLSCILTAALVLLLAFFLKWEWLSPEHIHGANTLIKALAACAAGLLCAKALHMRVWLSAGIAGVLYMALTYAVFALIEGELAIGVLFASDCIMAFACACAAAVMRNLIGNLSPK